jgi:hypothetical protein
LAADALLVLTCYVGSYEKNQENRKSKDTIQFLRINQNIFKNKARDDGCTDKKLIIILLKLLAGFAIQQSMFNN